MLEAREAMRAYYACMAYMDAQVGRVLDALTATGLDRNTIVVLWGDHGWHLGDHQMWCKHANFEQATRAPLIIHYPGQPNQGELCHSPVEFTEEQLTEMEKMLDKLDDDDDVQDAFTNIL